jgi:hypothetical protein
VLRVPVTVFYVLLFFSISSNRADAQVCQNLEEKVLCHTQNLVTDKNRQHFRNLGQQIPFLNKDRNLGLCQLGIQKQSEKVGKKEIIKTEASKLAPLLQKLDSIRESRSFIEKSETGEIDKLERILKKSSLLSYSSSTQLEDLTQQIQKEKVWNPNQLSGEIENKLTSLSSSLGQNNFPDDVLNEMSFAKNLNQECSANSSIIRFLKDSAQNDTPRFYHFKKALAGEFKMTEVEPAFEKCRKKVSPLSACQLSKEEKIKNLEVEFSEQVCVLKELFPRVGSQLNPVSLEIPSIAGDLVTEGPGERPTEKEAKSKEFKFNIACKEDFSLGGIARMAAGAGASFVSHELSHEAVATITGTDLKWNMQNGTWKCQDCSEYIRPIAIAGLASHSISSEYIVQNPSKDSQFQKGWLFFNVYNTSAYFIRDWMARAGKLKESGFSTGAIDKSGAGDLRAFTKKESYLLGAAMIGHQLFSAYRYVKDRQDYQCKKEW